MYKHETVHCYVCGDEGKKSEMTTEKMGPHQLDEFICGDCSGDTGTRWEDDFL